MAEITADEANVYAEEHGWCIKKSQVLPLEGFNLKPAENWETSLMECGHEPSV